MPVPKTTLESAHTIISVTLLPTGRLIMATEKRMYELVSSVWTPMQFAPEPDAEPAAASEPATGTVPPPPPNATAESDTETHS
jgi:hypothetical protein